MRIRGVPFNSEVVKFINGHEEVHVLEMNTDGQMHQLLQLEVPEQAANLNSLTHNNGLPLTARWIAESLVDPKRG